jgi:hypothetical protein
MDTGSCFNAAGLALLPDKAWHRAFDETMASQI